MMKKRRGIALLMAACLLTGCGGSTGAADTSSGEGAVQSGSNEVNVICWTEYLPQEVLDSFESETGIRVNMTTYTSPDDMLAKVQTSKEGTYDMIIAPENYVTIFSGQGILAELDRSRLDHFSNINESYLGRKNDPENTYSVPYMFASAVIAVNTNVIGEDVVSYADLLKEDYADQIVIIEDSRAVYAMAAMATGYEANDTGDEAMEAVEGYLKALLPNIHAFDGDSPKTLMINGECPIGLIYGAEALLAQQENPAIQCYYPEEGVYLGSDSMMVTAAGNEENAYRLIDYILDGEVSARISEIFPYINPNKAAVEALGSDYQENILTNPPADVAQRACTVIDIGDETSKIVELWTKIKG